jgi:hypothetical protein
MRNVVFQNDSGPCHRAHEPGAGEVSRECDIRSQPA